MHDLDDVRGGFDVTADAIVVGSGAGGAVAARNLAASGRRVVVLEAGPRVQSDDMVRDAPRFLARYFWEGGLRMVGGTSQIPSLQGRCVGGSTVVNSAIMLALPRWVRQAWADESGYESTFLGGELDEAYERVFERLRVAPTPLAVMGRRNLLVRDALAKVGIEGKPLPRAVVDCDACSDCLTGCAGGHKQSVDRSYLADAELDGAEVFTHSTVERVEVDGGRATGVSGWVIDRAWKRVARFSVRAPLVVLAAGALHTPAILQGSGLRAGGTVGSTFFAHIGGGIVGIMEEVVDPWVGATQGWGAISEDIQGMKYECLWASPSVLMVRWGDVGRPFMERLDEVKHATVIALVYRGRVRGRVDRMRSGMPRARIWIPDDEARVVLRGMKVAADALLGVGARYVHTGIPGVVDEMRTAEDTESLLHPKLRARDLQMTMNHVFGSCRMSRDGAVDETAKLRGVEGVYVCDASVFPSPSAVNPQATVMALSDLASRRLAAG